MQERSSLYGYTSREAIGRSITMLLPPEHVDEVPEYPERVQSGEFVDNYETVRQRKDGSVVEVSLATSPILGTGRNGCRRVDHRKRHLRPQEIGTAPG